MGNIRKFDFIAGIETSTAPVATDPVSGSDPVILSYANSHYTQGTLSQADNTAIKGLSVADRTNGDVILVRSTGFLYRYDSSSSVADDGEYFLQPTSGSGRYIKIGAIDPATGDLDVPNDLDVGGDVTVTGSVTVTGDATINGTLTTINSATLEITDANITLNNGGTESTADTQDSGFTVEMSDATDCKVGFDSTLASKFMCGEVGSEYQIVTTGHTQTMTAAKTFNEETSFLKSHVMTELGSTPATPSAGTRKMYATSTGFKEVDSAGLVSDLGGGGGSGSGEVNLIADLNTASGEWDSTGAGVTVATSTTSSELPLFEAGILSGIKITPVSGTSDYAFYRFTLPSSLANTKLKIEWFQEALSGYTSDDLQFLLYLNSQTDYLGSYTEIPISSDDSSGDTFIKNLNGKFVCAFDSSDGSSSGSAYEIRFKRASGTTGIVLQNVIVGPGSSLSQGPVVTDWESFTPTGSLTTNVTYTGTKRRVGDTAYYKVNIAFSGVNTQGIPNINIPDGTIDSSKIAGATIYETPLGLATVKDASASGAIYPAYVGYNNTTSVRIVYDGSGATSSIANTSTNAPITFAASDDIQVEFSVPILEWSGKGTSNFFGSGIKKNRFQTKFLSSTVTTTTASITDLAFSNLVVGRTYRIVGQAHLLDLNGTDSKVEVLHNSGIIASSYAASNNTTIDWEYRAAINSAPFVAVNSDLTVSATLGTGSEVRTSGDAAGTWICVEELNNLVSFDSSISNADLVAGFSEADENSAGLVSTGTQTFGGNKTFAGDVALATKTPSSASDTGTTGTVAWDSGYIYVCTATDTWKRVAIATW